MRFLLLLACFAGTGFGAEKGLDIFFIDVEGGAATLIVTPAGESILIDSGYPDNNGRDRDRVLQTARKAGLKRIDHAVVTHWHRDHYGNHAALATEIPMGTFWDRGIPDSLQEDKSFPTRIADYRRACENKSKALKPGDMLPLKQTGDVPLKVTVLTSGRKVVPNKGEENPFASEHKPIDRDKSDNAASLTLLFQYGDFRFLCCGDLTWNVEAKLVTPKNPIGRVDVFMVTHHGLPNSNNPALVLAVDPVVAVMCNGPTKGGHVNTQRTLRRVKSMQKLFQLHRNVKLDDGLQTGSAFIANSVSTADCKGNGIQLSVKPDARSYTVRIDGKKESHQFDTRAALAVAK